MRRWGCISAGTAALAVAVMGIGSGAVASAAGDEVSAQRLGLQQVPKHRAGKSANVFSNAKGANPFIALVPDPSRSDYAYWKSAMKQQAAKREAQRTGLAVEPLLVDEAEPDGLRGGNDTLANAQLIPAFGSAAGRRPAARILGTLVTPPAAVRFDAPPEDNGSISLAGETGLEARSAAFTESTIGDGPHGDAGDGTGDGTGDFDFYAIRDASAGQPLVVDIDTPTRAA